MTAAENLANELYRSNDDLQAQVDELSALLAEAETIIDATKAARNAIDRLAAVHYRKWNDTDSDRIGGQAAAYADVVTILDRIEGL